MSSRKECDSCGGIISAGGSEMRLEIPAALPRIGPVYIGRDFCARCWQELGPRVLELADWKRPGKVCAEPGCMSMNAKHVRGGYYVCAKHAESDFPNGVSAAAQKAES